jgi:HlyD family secretion protein
MPEGEMPQRTQGMANGTVPEKGNSVSGNLRGNTNIPDGYEIRQVVIGISDGTNIEIVSGLSEGETIAYIPSSGQSTNPFFAMMSGMHGGGMPGGMSGGNRGGMSSGGKRQSGGMPGGR